MRIDVACRQLAELLTAIWETQRLDTWLSLFLAGYEDGGNPRFWYVSNGGFPTGEQRFPRTFDAVDDLDDVWFPRNAASGGSKEALIARSPPSFRRGVLAAARIFDRFNDAVSQTLNDGHVQLRPLDSLQRYAAYTRFRFEFTKRMYDTKYGFAIEPYPPVRGAITVVSVDPAGTRLEHGKHVSQAAIVA